MTTQLHPLHSLTFITECIVGNGHLPGQRRTGRTTAIAHAAIAEAMLSPFEWLTMSDHVGGHPALILDVAKDIVARMNYRHFQFEERVMHGQTVARIRFGEPTRA